MNVCIGTDGAASNNCLDMVSEVKLAALLGKGVSNDATAVPAATVWLLLLFSVVSVPLQVSSSPSPARWDPCDQLFRLWLAFTTLQALRMATLNGAVALGLGSKCGSLEPGKFADMIAVRVDGVDMVPMYSVISHLVYVASKEK